MPLMLEPIAKPLEALEGRREALFESLSKLSEEQRGYRPADGGWTLLEVAEHLWIAENTTVAAIAQRPKGKAVRRSFQQRLNKLMVAVVLRLGLKVKAPSSSLEPRGGLSLEELRERWQETGARLRGMLTEVTAEELGHVAFRHPVSGPLDFAQGLGFLNRHFDHHLRQIGRVRAEPGFPGDGETS